MIVRAVGSVIAARYASIARLSSLIRTTGGTDKDILEYEQDPALGRRTIAV